MMKKVLLTAAVLTVLAATPAMAGHWEADSVGWYYLYDNNSYPKNGIVSIGGINYCFDVNGYMVTGWTKVNGQWYYCNPDGSMPTGWVQDNGRWYYFNSDSTMKMGFHTIDDVQYYFYKPEDIKSNKYAVEGAMATGGATIDGVTYYFDANGKQTNTLKSFERDGITYRYRGGVLQWENINESNEWIQFTTENELAADIEEMLIERYDGKRTYANAIKFQEEAQTMLGKRLTQSELDEYIDMVLEEYWGSNYRRND